MNGETNAPESISNAEKDSQHEEHTPLWNPRPYLGAEDDQPLDKADQLDEHQVDLRNAIVPPPTTGRH